MIFTDSINYLGIILAAIASMVIGMLWYTVLFGKKWKELMEVDPSVEMNMMKSAAAKKALGINFIATLVTAYGLERIQYYMVIPRLSFLLGTVILFWLAFVVATNLNEYLFATKPKPWLLFVLNQGNMIVSLLVMTLVIFYL